MQVDGLNVGASTGAAWANDTLAAEHLHHGLVRTQVVDIPAPLAFSGSARQRPAMADWPEAMWSAMFGRVDMMVPGEGEGHKASVRLRWAHRKPASAPGPLPPSPSYDIRFAYAYPSPRGAIATCTPDAIPILAPTRTDIIAGVRALARGCKLKTQKIPPGIEGTRIFSTNDLFEKVSDRNPRQSRTLMRPGAARHALFPSGQLETDRSISLI